ICFLAKAQRFHLRPLGVCQYEAIHTDFESHLVTLKKYNSQQTPIGCFQTVSKMALCFPA
ncbi:hypothetical protein, partial [Komagataeibacter sp. FXV3]|uniref:hypothetical protein n=1 Tax=Komagataeibacter sp. FXV3 TaxID=2608998 RepID=UPI001D0F9ECD